MARLGEPAEVRLHRAGVGDGRGVRGAFLVELLPRHGAVARQHAPALQIGLRESERGVRLLELRLRLLDVLLQLGRVDLGEHLPRVHDTADVGVPVAHVPRHASIDGAFVEGLDGARQCELAAGRGAMHGRHLHDGCTVTPRRLGEQLTMDGQSRDDRDDEQQKQRDPDARADDQQAPAAHRPHGRRGAHVGVRRCGVRVDMVGIVGLNHDGFQYMAIRRRSR